LQPPTEDAELTATPTLRDLARWLYLQLQAEYDHLTLDEAIDEGLIVNEHIFTGAERRFGRGGAGDDHHRNSQDERP